MVPLTTRAGQPLGYIHCSDKANGRFDDDDRAVLTQMAQMASIALENSTLYNEIRATDARKDEFLATLAHELRNPLAPISNSLQVLRAESDPVRLAESRKVIERQVGQLVHLVDDLLDVSRVSRGKLELRLSRVRLADVLRAAIETSQPVIDAHRHTLRVHQPAEDVWLDADLTRLAQVFSNLLNNGAKYMEPGGVIAVEASADADNVVVAVRDRGIGIAPDVLPYIFDMFVQADRSLERAQGGLGIGLTLVRRLVELHDGSVTVLSDGPGKGSEFVVRLPRAAAGVAETPALGATPTATADAMPARRILVVDDNKDAVDSLVLLLSLVGQSVVAARDGLDALEQFERFEPEVVVLDLGLARHQRLRSRAPHSQRRPRPSCDAGGAHRLGPGRGSPALHHRRLRLPPGQARRLRGLEDAACRVAAGHMNCRLQIDRLQIDDCRLQEASGEPSRALLRPWGHWPPCSSSSSGGAGERRQAI